MPFDVGGNILTSAKLKYFNDTNIVRDGLILYLDAGLASSYPGDGANVYDLSGNNYTFTLEGGIQYAGFYNASFYNQNGGIQKTSNTALRSAITLVQWLNTGDTTGLMLSGEPVGQTGAYYVGAYYPGQAFYSSNCGSPSYYIDTNLTTNPASPVNYIDDTWHMWEAKGLNFSSWTSTWNFLGYGAGYEINGFVGCIMMYNRTLTASESLQNYQALLPRFSTPY